MRAPSEALQTEGLSLTSYLFFDPVEVVVVSDTTVILVVLSPSRTRSLNITPSHRTPLLHTPFHSPRSPLNP